MSTSEDPVIAAVTISGIGGHLQWNAQKEQPVAVDYLYSTGHLNQVISELRRAVGQYARRNSYIKIGITSHPEQRLQQHQAERANDDDRWQRMVVIYETSSWASACKAEKLLIEHARAMTNECTLWNDKAGGGGRRPAPDMICSVYVLLDT